MTTSFNSEERFNEIVFENRNKEYGAYAIRKSHKSTVTQSMLISLSGVAILVFSLFLFGRGIDKLPATQGNLIPDMPSGQTIVLTPPDKPLEKVHPKDPLPPTTESGIVTASDDPNKTLDKTNENFNISKTPSTGSDSAQGTDPVVPEIIAPVENTDPQKWVDHMPEFEGNISQFIRNNLRYPQIAVDNGTEGIVALSFIVEKDGSIGDITIINKIGDGCTQEAIRVLKLMPKWKPGLNHGVPVRVIFNLPIRFRLSK